MDNIHCTNGAKKRLSQITKAIEYLQTLPQTQQILYIMSELNEEAAWIYETGYESAEEAIYMESTRFIDYC